MGEEGEGHCFLCFGTRAETEIGDQFWECSICSCRVHLECQRKFDAMRYDKPTGNRWRPVLCPNKHPLKRELQVRAPVDWRGDWQWRMNASWKLFMFVLVFFIPVGIFRWWSIMKTFVSMLTLIVEGIMILLAPLYFSQRSVDIAFSYFEAGLNLIFLLMSVSLLPPLVIWTTLRECFSFTIPRRVLYKWDK
jgi:hypothetical protein